MNKIISESLLLNFNEEVSKQEIVVEKLQRVKTKPLSGIIIFKASEKPNNLIDVDVYQLDKYQKKKYITTIHNVFSYDLIQGKSNGIEASFELASRFSILFKKSKFKKGKTQFYFTYHDETRGYNLTSGKWEKFI